MGVSREFEHGGREIPYLRIPVEAKIARGMIRAREGPGISQPRIADTWNGGRPELSLEDGTKSGEH